MRLIFLLLPVLAVCLPHPFVIQHKLHHDVAPCPCSDPSLCQVLDINYPQEVFMFSVSPNENLKNYDWSKLTTLVIAANLNLTAEQVCFAHQMKTRIIRIGGISSDDLLDPLLRLNWIADQLQIIQENYYDGINIDFEDEIPATGPLHDAFNDFFRELSYMAYAANPNYQVTADVAWSPNCIDGRCYDHAYMSRFTDFLFIMAYDEQSQIFGPCVAGPNAALNRTYSGLAAFFELGIPAEKLVLGVPWYGYDYECMPFMNGTCFIKEVPFRGVNCSDAAGVQRGYSDLNAHVTIRFWDPASQTPLYNYKTDTAIHQVWYDDPESLTLKYYMASQIRGVGSWNADSVDYSTPDAKVMWSILPDHKSKHLNSQNGRL